MTQARKTTGYWTLNRGSIQSRGLVGLWSDAGVNSGNRWRNIAMTSYNDAVQQGFPTPYTKLAGWATGVDGGRSAIAFNGGQHLLVTAMPSILATSFSVAVWAKWISTGTTTSTIQALVDNQHDTGKGFVLQDRPDLSKKLSFFVGGNSSVESTFQVGDGNWHHIVGTYDGTNARIYIDGQLNNTTATTSGTLQSSLYIGKTFNFSRFLTGTLEDLRLYNRVLKAADVALIYLPQTRWAIRYGATSKKIYSHVTQITDFVSSTTDTPTTSESVIVSQVLQRTVLEIPTISETVHVGNFLSKITNGSATLSEIITTNYSAGQSATDHPVVSETIVTQKMLFRSISQSLTITHSNLAASPVQSVEQGLVLSQSVGVVTDISKSIESELFFSHSADYEQFIPTEVSQSLTITQSADFVQTTGVGNTLTITQDVAIQLDPHFDGATQGLTPAQTVVVGAVFNRTLSQPLTLVQVVGALKIKPVSASNTLIIGQLLEGGVVRRIFNTLVLSQSVVQETFRNKSVSQSLAITQSVGLQMILNRSLVSILIFKDEHPVQNGAGGIIQIPNLIHTRGGSSFDNCSCTVPSATTVFQSSTRAIVLPNPEYSDSEGLVAAVSIQKTITGQTYSYVKKSANRKLKYKFIINQQKAYELRRFLLDFLGDRLTMTNWKGEMWTGYLLTDPAEIISTARGGNCTGDLYEVNLEYQGVRVN